jgi:hypothetical protein
MTVNKQIMDLIGQKGTVSIDVFEKSKAVFADIKGVLTGLEKDIRKQLQKGDPRIPVEVDDKGRLEVHFKFADDVLVFLMHTNIFTLDTSHPLMKSSYIKEDPMRAFCGMIYVYNFLYESVKYNRRDDFGILVARLFVNKEGHFFVEGKRRIGVLFNNFSEDVISVEKLNRWVEALMHFVLEIDMKVPPFSAMEQSTLQNIFDSSSQTSIISGKRFGFILPGADEEP